MFIGVYKSLEECRGEFHRQEVYTKNRTIYGGVIPQLFPSLSANKFLELLY